MVLEQGTPGMSFVAIAVGLVFGFLVAQIADQYLGAELPSL
jgi:hypothetical protein